MKFLYVIAIILIVLVSACAQKPVDTKLAQPVQKQQPAATQPTPQAPAEKTQTATPPAEPVKETVKPTTSEIKLLKKGLDHLESTVSPGSAVTWVNSGGVSTLLNINKDGKFLMRSNLLKNGDKFEQELKEKGTYVFWGEAYGIQGKIVVK